MAVRTENAPGGSDDPVVAVHGPRGGGVPGLRPGVQTQKSVGLGFLDFTANAVNRCAGARSNSTGGSSRCLPGHQRRARPRRRAVRSPGGDAADAGATVVGSTGPDWRTRGRSGAAAGHDDEHAEHRRGAHDIGPPRALPRAAPRRRPGRTPPPSAGGSRCRSSPDDLPPPRRARRWTWTRPAAFRRHGPSAHRDHRRGGAVPRHSRWRAQLHRDIAQDRPAVTGRRLRLDHDL